MKFNLLILCNIFVAISLAGSVAKARVGQAMLCQADQGYLGTATLKVVIVSSDEINVSIQSQAGPDGDDVYEFDDGCYHSRLLSSCNNPNQHLYLPDPESLQSYNIDFTNLRMVWGHNGYQESINCTND